jgi:hypothetical protein
MRRGAIALLDALGFKGIWKHHEWTPEQVIDKLQRALQKQTKFQANVSEVLEQNVGIRLPRFHFLSDTVVVVAESAEGQSEEPDDLVGWLCTYVQRFLVDMLDVEDQPCLAYRGAVTYGEFVIEPPFILGEAVDEAAEAERLAEGAFVWLCPSALDYFFEVPDDEHLTDLMPFRFPVPMKGGQNFETIVIPPFRLDPLAPCPTEQEAMAGLQSAFRMPSRKVDVQIKFQNTSAMIRAGLARYPRIRANTMRVVSRDLGPEVASKWAQTPRE